MLGSPTVSTHAAKRTVIRFDVRLRIMGARKWNIYTRQDIMLICVNELFPFILVYIYIYDLFQKVIKRLYFGRL